MASPRDVYDELAASWWNDSNPDSHYSYAKETYVMPATSTNPEVEQLLAYRDSVKAYSWRAWEETILRQVVEMDRLALNIVAPLIAPGTPRYGSEDEIEELMEPRDEVVEHKFPQLSNDAKQRIMDERAADPKGEWPTVYSIGFSQDLDPDERDWYRENNNVEAIWFPWGQQLCILDRGEWWDDGLGEWAESAGRNTSTGWQAAFEQWLVGDDGEPGHWAASTKGACQRAQIPDWRTGEWPPSHPTARPEAWDLFPYVERGYTPVGTPLCLERTRPAPEEA